MDEFYDALDAVAAHVIQGPYEGIQRIGFACVNLAVVILVYIVDTITALWARICDRIKAFCDCISAFKNAILNYLTAFKDAVLNRLISLRDTLLLYWINCIESTWVFYAWIPQNAFAGTIAAAWAWLAWLPARLPVVRTFTVHLLLLAIPVLYCVLTRDSLLSLVPSISPPHAIPLYSPKLMLNSSRIPKLILNSYESLNKHMVNRFEFSKLMLNSSGIDKLMLNSYEPFKHMVNSFEFSKPMLKSYETIELLLKGYETTKHCFCIPVPIRLLSPYLLVFAVPFVYVLYISVRAITRLIPVIWATVALNTTRYYNTLLDSFSHSSYIYYTFIRNLAQAFDLMIDVPYGHNTTFEAKMIWLQHYFTHSFLSWVSLPVQIARALAHPLFVISARLAAQIRKTYIKFALAAQNFRLPPLDRQVIASFSTMLVALMLTVAVCVNSFDIANLLSALTKSSIDSLCIVDLAFACLRSSTVFSLWVAKKLLLLHAALERGALGEDSEWLWIAIARAIESTVCTLAIVGVVRLVDHVGRAAWR